MEQFVSHSPERRLYADDIPTLANAAKMLQTEIREAVLFAEQPEAVSSRKIIQLLAELPDNHEISDQVRQKLEQAVSRYLTALDIPAIIGREDEPEIEDLLQAHKLLMEKHFGDFVALKAVYAPYLPKMQLEAVFSEWTAKRQELIDGLRTDHFDRRPPEEFCTPEILAQIVDTEQRGNDTLREKVETAEFLMRQASDFSAAHPVPPPYNPEAATIDCNDRTAMSIALARWGKGLSFHPVFTENHVGLQIERANPRVPGHKSVIFDPFNNTAKTDREFTEQPHEIRKKGSYFYMDSRGYLLRTADPEQPRQTWQTVAEFRDENRELLSGLLNAEGAQYFHRSTIVNDLRFKDHAEKLYTLALLGNPQEEASANNLGSLQREKDATEDEEFYYRHAITANPFRAEAYFNIAVSQTNQGDFESATRYYRECLERSPLHPGANNNLASLKMSEAQKLTSDPNTFNLLAKQIQQHLERALTANPEHTYSKHNLAELQQMVSSQKIQFL